MWLERRHPQYSNWTISVSKPRVLLPPFLSEFIFDLELEGVRVISKHHSLCVFSIIAPPFRLCASCITPIL